MTANIQEPARSVPVATEVDLCVVGGSATGVFAAVAAARRGLKTAIVEANGFFGGVATAGLVSIWHSLFDTEHKQQIIAGLTQEILERLKKRAAVITHEGIVPYYVLNTEELKIELDELIIEARVRPFLHAFFSAPVMEGNRIIAAVIEDKTGRRAIRAKYFIDATGDGDLLARAGYQFLKLTDMQPPTTCAVIQGVGNINLVKQVFCPENEDKIPFGFLWQAQNVAVPTAFLVAGTRVPKADCSNADALTDAEIEGRRQVRVIMNTLRKRDESKAAALVALAAWIGVRETRHAKCRYILTDMDLLQGRRFEDAVANGSYPVDMHHSDKPGITFRYLNGIERYVLPDGNSQLGKWREPLEKDPTFYQIPFSALLPEGAKNLLVAGRLIGAERGAYGAIRVMVNCNQTGEAAGAAAALAADKNTDFDSMDFSALRQSLIKGGAIII